MAAPLDYETPSLTSASQRWAAWYASLANAKLVGLATFGAALTLVAPALELRPSGQGWLASVYGALVLGVVLTSCVRGKLSGRPVNGNARWSAAIIAVVFLCGLINVQACPHATYVRFGPLLIAVTGDACGNPQPVRLWTTALLR